MLLKPKTIKVKTLDNEELEVTISRLPATVWDDLIPNFVAGQIPKVDNILKEINSVVRLYGLSILFTNEYDMLQEND